MKKITVIGAGKSGLSFIEKIKKNSDWEITLVDKNRYSFPRLDLILHPADTRGRIDLSQWSQENKLEFINDSLEKLNLKRKRLSFKQSEPREFDVLVVATGLTSRKIAVKGEHREGFFYLSQIDPFKLKDLLRISAEATVNVSTWLGIKLILALVALGKEVKLVSADLDFLGVYKERVLRLLEERKVNLYLNASLDEAVGEGAVKAAKISPLKIFSSQLVFIDSAFSPNLSFLEEEVAVEKNFFTEYEGVYFLGDVTRKDIGAELFYLYHEEDAGREAHIFADFILEGKAPIFERRVSDTFSKGVAIEKFLDAAAN